MRRPLGVTRCFWLRLGGCARRSVPNQT